MTLEAEKRWCSVNSDMLNYGCTRLEIGVQSVHEDVARDTNRYQNIIPSGHSLDGIFSILTQINCQINMRIIMMTASLEEGLFCAITIVLRM